MNESKVFEYIRRDGKTCAPVLFLTIEDGGGNFASIDELRNYLESEDVWAPDKRKKEKTGKPGTIISKIILGIVNGNLKGWRSYRDEYLYLENEVNLKFYPIGRPKTNIWRDFYSECIGLDGGKYIKKCLDVRPDIIWLRYRDCFASAKLIVILGELKGWRKLLQSKKGVGSSNEPIESYKKGHVKWAFYYSDDGKLEYTYFNMFRWGIRDDEILEYCARLKTSISSELIDELCCNLKKHNDQLNIDAPKK
jgi:hypothetical protein